MSRTPWRCSHSRAAGLVKGVRVALQQFASGRAGQGAKLALPVVIVQESRIAHFLRIEFAGVAHQLVDLARAKTRETAFQIRQGGLAPWLPCPQTRCPG